MNSGRAVRPLPRGRRNGILDRAGALSPYIKHRGPGLLAAREDTDVEGTGARILIVEDDADINRLLTTPPVKGGIYRHSGLLGQRGGNAAAGGTGRFGAA